MGDQRWRPFWIGFSLKFSWLQFPKWKNADMNHQNGIVKIARPCLSIEIMIMKNHQPNGRRVWGTLRAIWCLERGNPWSWGKMYRKPQPIPYISWGEPWFPVSIFPWSNTGLAWSTPKRRITPVTWEAESQRQLGLLVLGGLPIIYYVLLWFAVIHYDQLFHYVLLWFIMICCL